jgi:hypothetical protein
MKTIQKNVGLFILLVVIDIVAIHLFRHFTPLIIPLRLGFVFVVISISIMVYFVMTKPLKPVRAGVVISLIGFIIALGESYIVHVIVEHGHYRLLYLLPSSFALVLPFAQSVLYQKFIIERK